MYYTALGFSITVCLILYQTTEPQEYIETGLKQNSANRDPTKSHRIDTQLQTKIFADVACKAIQHLGYYSLKSPTHFTSMFLLVSAK
jgi:hypothetical protein